MRQDVNNKEIMVKAKLIVARYSFEGKYLNPSNLVAGGFLSIWKMYFCFQLKIIACTITKSYSGFVQIT